MTTRARSSIHSYFKPGDEPTLDDRGRPFTMAPNELITPLLWKRTPISVWCWNRFPILILIAVAFMLYFSDFPTSITWDLLYPFLSVLVFSIFWRASNRNSPLLRHSTLTALLVAYRRCGGCAYDLHDVSPDAEGFIACPECGASWHHSRCTRADRDFREDPRLKALVVDPYKYSRRGMVDHRALPLNQEVRWPLHWHSNVDVSEQVLRGLNAIFVEQGRRYRTRALPLAALLWIIATAGFYIFLSEGTIGALIVVAIVFTIIVGVLYYAFWRVWMDHFMITAGSDRLGTCNHCGQALPDTPPEFDGCRVCAKCGAAWKVGTHASPVVEPATA